MSEKTESSVRVRVDPANPGQFFACCGLLELADRLWDGAESWFGNGEFVIRRIATPNSPECTLAALLAAVAGVTLVPVDPEDEASSPIDVATPFKLRLDWWKDNRSGGDRLKVWAGSMRNVRIARAMQHMLHRPEFQSEGMFDHGAVVYDPEEPDKKVEPFYFDARRGSNALAIDVGFSPDSLQLTTAAYPAVEFLCLVGLQRYRPMSTAKARLFEYCIWGRPLDARVAVTAACGLLESGDLRAYRFENAFRTDQRKHKAFNPATPIRRS